MNIEKIIEEFVFKFKCKKCGEENIFNIKNILKKLFDMNLKAVFESSSKK